MNSNKFEQRGQKSAPGSFVSLCRKGVVIQPLGYVMFGSFLQTLDSFRLSS